MSNSVRAQRRSGVLVAPITALAFAVLLLLGHCTHVANAFAFVPVIHSFAQAETSGSKAQSRLTCLQGGGYLAAEGTATLHTAVVQSVRAAGAGTTWYAYLGSDTTANPLVNCPAAVTEDRVNAGATYGCYWRWNQGRWGVIADNSSLPLYIGGVGVTFYVGNTYAPPVSTAVTVYGSVDGFPNYFTTDTTAVAARDRRPGQLFGQHLLAVGSGDSSLWSDNLQSGGYSYAGYTYNRFVGNSVWNATAMTESKAYFWAACQAQSPTRSMYELENTSSGLQQNWWVIFTVVLAVVTLVAFIIIAACQEDEDMDEPPEDAPEWAQQETLEAKRPKSFVSTRSFRNNNNDNGDDYEDEADNRPQRQGSMRSVNNGNSNRGSFRGNPHSDTDSTVYQDAAPQYGRSGMASNAGSSRNLARQNGSSYNMQQQQQQHYHQQQGGYQAYGGNGNQGNNWM